MFAYHPIQHRQRHSQVLSMLPTNFQVVVCKTTILSITPIVANVTFKFAVFGMQSKVQDVCNAYYDHVHAMLMHAELCLARVHGLSP